MKELSQETKAKLRMQACYMIAKNKAVDEAVEYKKRLFTDKDSDEVQLMFHDKIWS